MFVVCNCLEILSPTTTCYDERDPLSCYLEQNVDIQISPPALCADLGDNVHFCMTNLDCYGISIDQIQADYITPTSMMVGVVKAGVECEGNWNLTQKFLHEEGSVDIEISHADIEIIIQLTKSQMPPYQYLPNATQFSSCTTNPADIEVCAEFSGLNPVFDATVQGAIKVLIPQAIQDLVCIELANFMKTNGTALLVESIDPSLQSLIDSPADTPMVYQDTVNWSLSNIVNFVDGIVNFVNSILSSSSLFSSKSLSSHMLWYTDGPKMDTDGVIIMNVDTTIVVDAANITALIVPWIVYVEKIELEGLNTLSDLVLLSPNAISNSSLDFGLKLQHIQSRIYYTTWLGNSSYHHNYTAILSMSSLDLMATVDVAINESNIAELYVDQLIDEGCILSAMERLYVSSIDLVTHRDEDDSSSSAGLFVEHLEIISNITDDDEDTLEYDIVALMNQTLLLGTAGFEELVSDFIGGALQGPIRSLINDQIAQMENSASACTEHDDTSNEVDYVIFCESSLISKFDYLVNELIGTKGINLLMIKIGNQLTFNILGMNITVSGLDSFEIFDILHPFCGDENKEYELGNELLLGFCDDKESLNYDPSSDSRCRSLKIQIDFGINPSSSLSSSSSSSSSLSSSLLTQFSSSLLGTASYLTTPYSITLTLQNLYVVVDLFAQFDLNKFKNLQVNQLCLNCFIAALDELKLGEAVINATKVTLLMPDNLEEEDITVNFNALLSQIGQYGLLDTLFINTLTYSKQKCAEGPNPVPDIDDDDGVGLTLNLKIIITILSMTAILAFYVFQSDRNLRHDKIKIQAHHGFEITHESLHNVDSYKDYLRNRRSITESEGALKDSEVSPPYAPPEMPSSSSSPAPVPSTDAITSLSSLQTVHTLQEECQQDIFQNNNLVNKDENHDNKPSMSFDKRLSIYYRVLVPSSCLICFGLFLWSNNDVGATVCRRTFTYTYAHTHTHVHTLNYLFTHTLILI